MARIEKGRAILTLINVFTAKAGKQAALAELLIRATDETMRHLPGFISASIHRSLDGTRVVNYAQWQSQKDWAAIMENPTVKPHMQAAMALATSEPIVCEVLDSVSIDE